MVVDIDRELLEQISAQIGRAGGECLAVVADVSQRDYVENVLRSTVEKFGRVDILFNNAGIVPTGKLEAISEEQWDRAMAINVNFSNAVLINTHFGSAKLQNPDMRGADLSNGLLSYIALPRQRSRA